MSWVSGPAGEGVGFAEVEAVTSWRGRYLIIRASSASWVAEVVCHECIRLCSGDTSLRCWVAGCLFVGIIGSLSWPLVHHFILLGGLHTASRMSWMSFWTWDHCIVISCIMVEVIAVPGDGGADMAVRSSSVFVRESTAALSSAVSSMEAW
jgi:hypothetical protein